MPAGWSAGSGAGADSDVREKLMIHTRIAAGAAIGMLILASCSQPPARKGTSNVEKKAYGTMPDGTPIDMYTLTNAKGMQAGIITYGGAVASLTAPDRSGQYADVVLCP